MKFASLLMETFEAESKSTTPISVGGLITPIALHFDIDLSIDCPQPEPIKVEMSALRIDRFITTTLYFLTQKREDNFQLPNPALTRVSTFED